MMVDISSKKHWDGGEEEPIRKAAAVAQTKPKPVAAPAPSSKQGELTIEGAVASKREPAIKKGFLSAVPGGKQAAAAPPTPAQQSSKKDAPRTIQEIPPAPPSCSSAQPAATSTSSPAAPKAADVKEEVAGPIAPVYTLKERGTVSWGDFEQMRNNTAKPPTSTRPAELICRIEIPKVTAMADMILDVSERRLQLSYRADYLLSIALPYPVLDKKGIAKYDKASKCLTVTLPVQPPPAPTAAIIPESRSTPSPLQDEVDKDDPNSATHEEKRPSPKSQPQEAKNESHKRWVSGADEEEVKLSQNLKEEIKKQMEKAKAEISVPSPSSNPGFSSSKATIPTAALVEEEYRDRADTADFFPSETFIGKRTGSVFKRGDKGMGYYVDKKPPSGTSPSSDKPKAATAPTLEAVTQTKEFAFASRQTPGAVAVLVQVPGIDPTTVAISFLKHLVQVKFASAGSGVGDKVWHALDLVPLAELNPKGCRFDVVQRNMVLVLAKHDESAWNEEGVDLITAKPYSGGSEIPAPAQAAPAPSKVTKVSSVQEKVESMNFAQNSSVLFELD